ncbi:MAG: hypothetical protein LUI06_01255 [Ruminococcus sp.]|nr:hypothetical protein [Ruminococcus sp.]
MAKNVYKDKNLWEILRPEPAKIDYHYPPHLIRLHIELLDFGDTEPSEKLLKAETQHSKKLL